MSHNSHSVNRRIASRIALIVVIGFSHSVFAADPPAKGELTAAELIEAQLAEAKELLAEDKANHDETARKKAEIDEKLSAREEREAKIREELNALCEEQEKLSPGSLEDCLEKINN